MRKDNLEIRNLETLLFLLKISYLQRVLMMRTVLLSEKELPKAFNSPESLDKPCMFLENVVHTY